MHTSYNIFPNYWQDDITNLSGNQLKKNYNISCYFNRGIGENYTVTSTIDAVKYSLNENFNLLPYVEWDRFVTLTGAQAEWGLRYRI